MLLLHSDVAWVEKEIHALVKVDLNQHQFDAVGDFVFKVGSGNFEHSTLLIDLNTGLTAAARFYRVWLSDVRLKCRSSSREPVASSDHRCHHRRERVGPGSTVMDGYPGAPRICGHSLPDQVILAMKHQRYMLVGDTSGHRYIVPVEHVDD
jgi:hypothetical protein